MSGPSNNLIQDFAAHPDKWAACNKDYVARSLGATVEDLEARISAAAVELKKRRGITATPIDTRKAKTVPWLYTGRFPGGKLTILDGDPGLSKSMFSLALAVSVLTGKAFLGMIKPELTGGVVLLSAEDDLEDTIIPRLVAAGCPVTPEGIVPNLFHVPCLKPSGQQLSLSDALDRLELEELIQSCSGKLMIIDPLNAYLGDKADSHNDQKMRQVLGPLSDLANRTGAMILGLRHLNKGGGGKAIYRGLGSIGYTAAARANFFAAEHPDEEGVFVVAASKFNLGPKPSSIKYRLAFAEVPGVQGLVPHVANGENCDLKADELAASQSDDAEESGKLKDAMDFLQQALSLGPIKSQDGIKQARKLSISERTLIRARQKLKVKAVQTASCWYWQLPDETRQPNETLKPDVPF
jgi:putative DNA primase/helicase